MNLYYRVRSRVKIAWYWLLSFRKRSWTLNDYPIHLREQVPDSAYANSPRFKHYRYSAFVLNWHIHAAGETKSEAMTNLAMAYENACKEKLDKGENLPRPGTKIAFEIQIAAQDKISRFPELLNDFIQRVLGHEWAFLTDESTLWDFHTDETNDNYYSKIKDVYGVDVSDLKDGRIYEILERINANQRPD
jgi:hypothetical protein